MLLLLALFALAAAENQTQEFYPNCDLVATSHVAIRHNDNATLDIDFSWDRKEESYQRIGGPIRQYIVRHGAWKDDTASNDTQVTGAASDQDTVTLKNVKPYKRYFVQVCAVTKSYRFLFQSDLWNHAWTGWMDLSGYADVDDSQAPDEDTTAVKENRSFSAQCDLVQTSYVGVDQDPKTKKLTVRFSWDKKQVSYQNIGPVDHYLVRHGPEPTWGATIDEAEARYLIVPNDTNSMVLNDIKPGGMYGLQICGIFTNDMGINQGVDWDKQAWTGSMNFTDYGSLVDFSSEEDSGKIETAAMPESRNSVFSSRCDLVQTSYVTVEGAPDSRTLVVGFSWDKKQASYKSIGTFDHYLVRHGRLNSGSDMSEEAARYLPITDGTTGFTLTDVPPNTRYGVQICAIANDDVGIDQGIDWNKEAWLGTMDLSSFADYAPKTSEDGQGGLPEPTNEVTEGDDAVEPVRIARISLGDDYGILLLALAVIATILTMAGCVWIYLRKRRNAKMETVFDPTTKEGAALP